MIPMPVTEDDRQLWVEENLERAATDVRKFQDGVGFYRLSELVAEERQSRLRDMLPDRPSQVDHATFIDNAAYLNGLNFVMSLFPKIQKEGGQ